MSRCLSRISGFTLLEMLVALALMGVLAMALYGSLRIGFTARERAEAALGPLRSARLALDLLRREIVAAPPPRGILAGPFLGEDMKAVSGEDADTLLFHSVDSDSSGEDLGIRRVEFILSTPEGEKENLLLRRVTTNLLAPKTPEPKEEVLCRNVLSLNLRYFDGLIWSDSWDSTTRENSLPLALEVTLKIRAGSEVYQLGEIFLLPCGMASNGESGVRSSSM